MNLGGFLGGLGSLIEKLSELAEKGEELKQGSGQLETERGVRAVYGFTVRTGPGRDREREVQVEPFGNVRKAHDNKSVVVDEVREPAVDIFEEDDHVLVVVELPGVGAEDVRLELSDDVLTLTAERGPKKYRKEVLLPAGLTPHSHRCHNGVLEVKLTRS